MGTFRGQHRALHGRRRLWRTATPSFASVGFVVRLGAYLVASLLDLLYLVIVLGEQPCASLVPALLVITQLLYAPLLLPLDLFQPRLGGLAILLKALLLAGCILETLDELVKRLNARAREQIVDALGYEFLFQAEAGRDAHLRG